MTLSSDLVGRAIEDYANSVMYGERTGNVSPESQFLYKFSEPDSFDCVCCGANLGVSLFGDADQYASWTDIVLMDAEADRLSIYCVPCYETLWDDIEGEQS